VEPPLGRRLYLGQRAVADVLDRRLADQGASLWNWVLLREAAHAGGSSQRELAGLMRIEPSTLVRHLDRLEADGYVERRPDPADRRRARIFVTRSGRARLKALQKVAQGMDVELRALLTPEEVEVLGDVLMRLHHHFTDADVAAVPAVGVARSTDAGEESSRDRC
jgi:DNA-binding MarR family transcriptional regulator